MAKGKYEYWLTDDGLTLLAAWKRDGLTEERIAKKCEVAYSTLRVWKEKYAALSAALTRGKELVDIDVENAMLKKCIGYTVTLQKTIKVKRVIYDPETGKKAKEFEELVPATEEMHIPADEKAQEFWLKNRKRAAWQDKPAEQAPEKVVQIIDDI